ncbi:hypothetical protein PGIGA_G00197390, partial [Pangasianodon gigas]|nr:hypothetical protein [Pangasianodon gigas]
MSLGIGGTACGVMEEIHICSPQTLHWCPTRLSTWSSPVLPLYSISWCGHILTWVFIPLLLPLNSSSPSLPQTLMFLLRYQHVWQISHQKDSSISIHTGCSGACSVACHFETGLLHFTPGRSASE